MRLLIVALQKIMEEKEAKWVLAGRFVDQSVSGKINVQLF